MALPPGAAQSSFGGVITGAFLVEAAAVVNNKTQRVGRRIPEAAIAPAIALCRAVALICDQPTCSSAIG
jgi:hypothetical protein